MLPVARGSQEAEDESPKGAGDRVATLEPDVQVSKGGVDLLAAVLPQQRLCFLWRQPDFAESLNKFPSFAILTFWLRV